MKKKKSKGTTKGNAATTTTTTTAAALPWWHSLADECPITLELLSSLPYPPFPLTTNNGAVDVISYFDGLALASYIVSRGIFQNPLTRQVLTMADCRRLDEYLERYCYNDKSFHNDDSTYSLSNPSTTRKICVAEAFALWQSISVVTEQHGHPHRAANADQGQRRAHALQSTATAAVAGLFVYGHDRRRNRFENNNGISTTTTPPREEQLILDWGFDLGRRIHDDSFEFSLPGLTVIDDDETLVVASQREAYLATQNAFPRLLPEASSSSSASVNHLAATAATDEQFLERVRELSVQQEQEDSKRQKVLQLARQRQVEESLARREERNRLRQEQRAQGAIQWQEKQNERNEIQQARAEIEQWRAEQWEKLRLMAEKAQQQAVVEEKRAAESTGEATRHDKLAPGKMTEIPSTTLESSSPKEELLLLEEKEEEKKKAKIAAKRKRAKERKKVQTAELRQKQAVEQKEKELDEKRAASIVRCAACQQGILDCGFEKCNLKFCSPKCARTGNPNHPTRNI